jgi:hypothetical protein
MMEPNKLGDPDAELALEVSVLEVAVPEMLPSAEFSPPWPPFLWAWWDNPEITALMALGMASTDMGFSCCDFGWPALGRQGLAAQGQEAAHLCRANRGRIFRN